MSRAVATSRRTGHQEHPWERARRLAFARWESEIRRAPYGQPLPDVAGFAHGIEPPAHWGETSGTGRLMAFSALPTTGPAYLVSIPARARRLGEGTLFRLIQPVKRVLPASDPTYGELLIDARNGAAPASREEILEGISPRAAGNVVPQLSELWHLPPPAIETLLLPLVGSLPWHGRPAGLDLYIEIEGWALARYRGFLSAVLELVPEWVRPRRTRSSPQLPELELGSGARIRTPSTSAGRPFSIQLRGVSAPPSPSARADAPARSIITYGSALTAEFEATLSSGRLLLLLTAEDVRRVPSTDSGIPDAVKAAVWGLHWWMPEPPDTPDWQRWLRQEEPRIRQALHELPLPPGESAGTWGAALERREFRDRLAQASFARARLRGASEVEETDLAGTVDALIRSTKLAARWALAGRGPLSRVLDRTESGRTARLRRTLEALVRERTDGLDVVEAVTAVRSRGTPASEWDVENLLERLRIRGVLFQDRSGRYRLA